jgi:hypothetical protein
MKVRRKPAVAMVCAALVLAAAACQGDEGEPEASGTTEASPPVSPEGPTGETPDGATGTGSPPVELTGKEFDPADFDDDSATIDNPWFPLQPGMRYVYEGSALDDDERIERRVVMTVTDLTKVIAGIRTLCVQELDYDDGKLIESDLIFYAQDVDGNVWQLGEYPEEYERGEIVKAPAWFHGAEGARAGLTMKISPQLDTPSYAAGWGPAVGWDDRAKIHQMGVETCVPVDCYTDVMVIREYNRDIPGASQLKYYAPQVGGVRVGWMGPNEEERERLTLQELAELDPDLLSDVRADVLAQDERGYEIREKVYGQTAPMEQLVA